MPLHVLSRDFGNPDNFGIPDHFLKVSEWIVKLHPIPLQFHHLKIHLFLDFPWLCLPCGFLYVFQKDFDFPHKTEIILRRRSDVN